MPKEVRPKQRKALTESRDKQGVSRTEFQDVEDEILEESVLLRTPEGSDPSIEDVFKTAKGKALPDDDSDEAGGLGESFTMAGEANTVWR